MTATPIKRRHLGLDLPRAPALAIAELRAAGHEAYAVGGAVRDALLGLPLHDVDIATSASPRQVAELFDRTHAVGAQFGVVLVVVEDVAVEVATFREDGEYADGRHPEAVVFSDAVTDARRRDFTINAMLYDPVAEEVLDPVGGIDDLEAGILRAIGEPRARFQEDQLRLLRCARFAAQLGFEIENETWFALQEMAPLVTRVSAERIRNELSRVLTGPRPGLGLRVMLYSGLLRQVLPEIEAMVGVAQPPGFHPEGDVFVHTCLALENLDRRTEALAWGALMHDVGKPPTFKVAERIRFDGHVSTGMHMAREILTRLRLDRETIERVVELVHLHLKFADVAEMRPATLKRFLRTPHFRDHMTLHKADCLAAHGDLSLYDFCREKLEELSDEELRPHPLLSGEDLIGMGLPPSPLFSEILSAVEDGQLEGLLTTREDAIEFIRSHWGERLEGSADDSSRPS